MTGCARLAGVLRRSRILAQILFAVAALLATVGAWAQGVAYTVAIDAPKPLAELLRNNLDLERWRGNPRLDRDQLQRLVKGAPEQVQTLVATEGYYSPTVEATLDTSGAQPVARITVQPGEPVLVGDVDLELRGFASAEANNSPFDAGALRTAWALPRGRVFRQPDWEAAKRALLRQVIATRYPRAQLVDTSATVDPEAHRANLRVVIDSGPEARFGGLRIEGLKRYPETVVTNLNTIKPGEEYSEAALQVLQGRLQDTGYFSSVEVTADMSSVMQEQVATLEEQQTAPAPVPLPSTATLPILIRVTENKYRNVSAGLGYSTNTGNRATLQYDDLSVFGLRMKSNLTLETRRQVARADFYYPTKPGGYNDSFGGGMERNDLNGEITTTATVQAKRAWGTPQLERSVQLELLTERKIIDGLPASRAKSLPFTYNITKRELDNLLLPNKGYALNVQLGGAPLPVLTDRVFLRGALRFIDYRPLSARATLILRGEAGAVASKGKDGIPSTYLFRAGGDQSVRGYGYQELGVRVGDAITGGRYLLAGSAEIDYWLKPQYGVAVFYDAGNAGDVFRELKPRAGYGVGARWRSPVGPINVDAAYGQAIHKWRLHFSLGFTF
ncbi:outer membrane protein assembly factor [Massilia arenosa]|uniref:Translocation and assembly module subunit TamA n=1 Tax=Zemynaea arenosa TaxID=2561931 RepID=A0A4Y9SDZ6_9BURK|nr:outer membrane protein assembly factor [Massilia arenosa]